MKRVFKKKKENVSIRTTAMLKLKNIKKDYQLGNSTEVVHALKGINLSFRKNEFVSILGPSGCGKTTLLNIIGGLDKYTRGNLIINGKTTKNYTDRDWDIYRNHRIGFIFQSYNLIPHQTILGNVELALTISGMKKKERIEKAKKALDKVGLSGMYYKHPNQLSGGQCQRVAIARALVNEPDILLADEPTGALDTVTSKQIMDLIKEISKEKLVIMVTHNPEIAEEYSSRIIRLLDGLVVDDTNPYIDETVKATDNFSEVNEKAKMSWWTAFKLSFRNLISKLKRTVLVCVAGSIGIVGVSTVLAISNGIQSYIDSMQDDMLSGHPVTVSEVSYDLASLMESMTGFDQAEIVVENGFVNVNSIIEYLIEQSGNMQASTLENNITEDYIKYIEAMPKEDYSAMKFDYGLELANNIYTEWDYSFRNNTFESRNMSISALTKMYTSVMEQMEDYAQFSSYVSQISNALAIAPNNPDYILSQYDLLGENSRIATKANEIMIVVNKDRQLTDITLAQLGYYSQEEFENILYRSDENSADHAKYDPTLDKEKFPYEELLNKTFRWYPNDSVFKRNENFTNPQFQNVSFYYNAYEEDVTNKEEGLELVVTGILQPKENISYGCLQAGFYYTEALANHVLAKNLESEIVKAYIGENKENIKGTIRSTSYNVPVPAPTPENPTATKNVEMYSGIVYPYTYIYEDVESELTYGYVGSEDRLSSLISSFLPGMGIGGMGTSKSYNITLRELGANDIPSNISIYPISFDSKYKVTDYLDRWNQNLEEELVVGDLKFANREEIKYADNLELVISMINTMIDIITYALIVFTALSLLVSTVMIGIITYVSVVERVKEIGVIRSLGGRKKDVANLFNAETFIIGLTSGIFGILITLGISGIINLIVGHFSGIYTIASLQVRDAIIMIVVSVLLTSISGLIPARAAANKNPVDALRTE